MFFFITFQMKVMNFNPLARKAMRFYGFLLCDQTTLREFFLKLLQ